MKFKILIFIYTRLFNIMTYILRMMEKCDSKDDMIKNVVVPHMENWIKANKDRGGVKMTNKPKPLSDGEFEECKAYWESPHNRYAIGAIGHIALEDIARLIATIEELKEHRKEDE